MQSTIAVWSNNGAAVAYMGNQQPIVYRYGTEEANKTEVKGVWGIEYNPGCHRATLSKLRKSSTDKLGEEGVFIQKHKNRWVKIGAIAWVEEIEENGMMRIIIVNESPIQLATNKPDSMRLLGYKKKMGKGTGTYMQGVCRIEPIGE